MDFALFVIIFNILVGWYNLFCSNEQMKRGMYSRSNWSFVLALLNIMSALAIVARIVYLEIICL